MRPSPSSPGSCGLRWLWLLTPLPLLLIAVWLLLPTEPGTRIARLFATPTPTASPTATATITTVPTATPTPTIIRSISFSTSTPVLPARADNSIPTRVSTPIQLPTATPISRELLAANSQGNDIDRQFELPPGSQQLVAETPTPGGIPRTVPTAVPGTLRNIPILMYHYVRTVDPVTDPMGYDLSVTPASFAAQLDWLRRNGYTPIRMEMVPRCLQGAAGCPAHPVALTFDDGYSDAYSTARPLLQERGFVATFYIVNTFVGQPGYMDVDDLRAMRDAGMEIGAHSLSHSDLTTLNNATASAEIADSRVQLAAMINAPVTSFCYPIGRFNARTRLLVQEADYISGVTTLQHDDYSDPYLLPRIRIHGNIDLTSFAWLVQNATTTY